MKKVCMSHMSWFEVSEKAKEKVCVLVPVGTTEAQNLHNPMGLDHMLPESVCEAAAQKCSAVIAPVIPYGDSTIFSGFPGVISLRPKTLENLLYDITLSLVKSGFDHIVFVNNHLPNEVCIENVGLRMREMFGLCMPSIFPAKIASSYAKKNNLIENPTKWTYRHGSEAGSSLCAYLWPDYVRGDLMQQEQFEYPAVGPFALSSVKTLNYHGETVQCHGMQIKNIVPNGGTGTPVADPEVGKKCFAYTVDFLAGFVTEFLKTSATFDKKEDAKA